MIAIAFLDIFFRSNLLPALEDTSHGTKLLEGQRSA